MEVNMILTQLVVPIILFIVIILIVCLIIYINDNGDENEIIDRNKFVGRSEEDDVYKKQD